MRRGLIGGMGGGGLAADGSGSSNLGFTVNSDGSAAVNEDPFIELKGGDGTNLVDWRGLLETTTERFEMRIRRDGTEVGCVLHVGTPDNIDARTSSIFINSASGGVARDCFLTMNPTQGLQIRSDVGLTIGLSSALIEFNGSNQVAVLGAGALATVALVAAGNDANTGFAQTAGADTLDLVAGGRNCGRIGSGSTANGSKETDLSVNRADAASPPVYSLQRVSWFDPGNLGANFTAGQKVLVIA